MKKKLFGILLPFCVSLVAGLVFYFTLMSKPFGWVFNTSFFAMIGALIWGFVSLGLLSFKSSRRWVKYIGTIPVLLALALFVLGTAITLDIRLIYFQGIPPRPSQEEWKKDLHFLAEQMNLKYPNISSKLAPEVMIKTVDEIEARIPSLTDSDIVMELFRLTALPNDAHTIPFVFSPCFDLHDLPLKFFKFEDGWYIIDAASAYSDLIGNKIVKIGSKPIDELAKIFKPYISAENEYAYLERFTYIAFIPEFLKSQGIIDTVQHVDLTLEGNDGEQHLRRVNAVRFSTKFFWSFMIPVDNRLSPVVLNPRKNAYWFELQNDTKTLYFQFNEVENQNGQETIAAFSQRLNEFVNTHDFDRFVIDLRNNMGGNDMYLKFLMDVIRDNKKVNRQNKLFVLIGRHTFSSAVLFAHKLKLQTKARLIGEPTSQGPVFGGNPAFIDLPNSKLMFAIATTSTARTQSPWIFKCKNAIDPDIFVPYRHDDFTAGKDLVMEKTLTYSPVERSDYFIAEDTIQSYTGRFIVSPLIVADITVVDKQLMITIDDFIDGNLFRVQTSLYPQSDTLFKSDISGMGIEFIKDSADMVSSLTLNWDGQEQVIERAPIDYTTAMELFLQKRVDEAINQIKADKETFRSISAFENALTTAGYDLMKESKTEEAIAVFTLTVELYPTSWNAYDSLGEAYMSAGNTELAIKNYEKSLALFPESKTGQEALKKLLKK